METILTPKEVAARLKVSPDTVRDLVRSGKLKGFSVCAGKHGKRFRVFETDLETYCHSQLPAIDKDRSQTPPKRLSKLRFIRG